MPAEVTSVEDESERILDQAMQRFPELFREGRPPSGFFCPTGWENHLMELLTKLGKHASDHPDERLQIGQVKEKYGALRVSVGFGEAPVVAELLRQNERASYKICEECGKPGVLRYGPWWRTLCEPHAEGRLPMVKYFTPGTELHDWASKWKGF